ncbi:sensor histidine kinase [Saccharopolyspora rhizosphaerae]|uniref:histidine kinase n=1 Tax=Saccharopolyspora rhizosphaerae TaxID=2492662 RepID=A0A3R8QQU8_9PSEU|nr:ATP-binding protein [Saccharopolyspora rhizosphaerae]RRO17597.1 sensor histidine kinase [Saccharopolyspora rhizosphaerae]
MSSDDHVPRRGEFPDWYPVVVGSAIAFLLSGALLSWAFLRSPIGAPITGVGVLLVLALSAAVGAVVRSVQWTRHYRTAAAGLNSDVVRLADDALPDLAERLRGGATAEEAVKGITHDYGVPHRRVLKVLSRELAASEKRRAAALSTCAHAAGRVQALTTGMLADLREVESRHDSEDVLADLLKLDHATAQAGRLADSIAVLTGARSGRRWTKPIVVESVLRGAMGRISAYQRIRLHSTSTAAVVGYAAEGVMHVLAEVMDNATKFSPPTEEVHVHVDEVHSGVVITVEDSGLALSDAARARAERAVSDAPLDLAEVSGARLGLAVVGCLARKHELSVSFRASARGGTGVEVVVPQKLITEPRPEAEPPAPGGPASPTLDRHTDPASEAEPGELPRHRRGRTLTAARSAPAPRRADDERSDAGARFGAFSRSRRDGSSTSDDDTR